MTPHKQMPEHAPRRFASVLMLWLAVFLSVAAGLKTVVPLDMAQSRQMSADAARSGDLPIQRSTAASLQSRLALASEPALDAVSAAGFDGPDAALAPHHDLDLPTCRAANGERPLAVFARSALPFGFRARAPPILA